MKPFRGLACLLLLPLCPAVADPPASPAGDDLVVRQVRDLGLKRCSELAGRLAPLVIGDAPHGADSTWNKQTPDDRLLSSFVSKGYGDAESHINLVFAPNLAGSCDAYYTETSVTLKQCAVEREETFKGWTYRTSLDDKTLVLADPDGDSLYLTPMGSGGEFCLLTRRTTIYGSGTVTIFKRRSP